MGEQDRVCLLEVGLLDATNADVVASDPLGIWAGVCRERLAGRSDIAGAGSDGVLNGIAAVFLAVTAQEADWREAGHSLWDVLLDGLRGRRVLLESHVAQEGGAAANRGTTAREDRHLGLGGAVRMSVEIQRLQG